MIAHLRLSTFCRAEPPACITADLCGHFSQRCCCTTFGLVKKINDKNDQESTICNVCDGEIHRRVWGWVDSLLPDCTLINYGAANNSWIKPNWWMALSEGRGSWEDSSTVTTFPDLEDDLEILQVVYDVDIQQLTDIRLLLVFFTPYLSREGLLSVNTLFNKQPVSNSVNGYTQSHLRYAQGQSDSGVHKVGKTTSQALRLTRGVICRGIEIQLEGQ